jgi:2-aminoadipate transaminase
VTARSRAISAIDDLQRRSAADPRAIGLGGGLPAPEQFPRRELTTAFLTVLERPGVPALQYGWPEGSLSLRKRIARRLRRRGGGIAVGEDDVIVTNGAQQAIALAVDLLCKPGDRIGVDAETYPAALELFRSRRVLPVRTSDPTAARMRALYVLPAMDNPRGQRASAQQRRLLLARGVPLIEDDAYADLCFDRPAGPSLAAAARDRVFQVGTFSKTLCPGLRVGWLVPPPRWRRRALQLKHHNDLQSNSLAQEVVDELLAHVDLDDRLQKLRRFYRLRAARLSAAVRRHLPRWRITEPAGGFALWVEPDQQVDEVRFLSAAVAEGVSFDPGSLFRPDAAPRPLALRLCFSATAAQRFDEGIRRLARAYARLAGAPATPAAARRRARVP